ncbi:MAG TPA: phosphatase PAP2 family protein [Solirubrobacteraceae bacterium]|jgi:undecaprenyl-diphosphatase
MWRRVEILDRRLMRHSFRTRSSALDRTLVAITRAANYSRLWLLLAGALALFGGRGGRRAAGRGLIAIAIAAAVANGPAKLLVRRRRPFSPSRPTLIRMPRSTSFPSGHTAAAFAFATAAGTELPVMVPALLPLAGAVAYSRVHTGVHYPSDVAAGMGIGIGSGLLAAHWPWRVHAPIRRGVFTRHKAPPSLATAPARGESVEK